MTLPARARVRAGDCGCERTPRPFRLKHKRQEIRMALRAKKPEAVEKRLKLLMFGMAGVGKTTAAIQFPRPYLIDTEKGAENAQYVKLLQQSGGAIFQTSDFDDMIREVTSLLSEKHEFRTLIIDPITVVYADLLAKSAEELRRASNDKTATGTEFGRHYAVADRKMKHMLNLLLRLDMNVIVTCHAKTVYGDGMVKLEDTFDGYKKLDYLFDLVLELRRRGKERVGVVRKTRMESFPEGEVFPFSYAAVAEKYGASTLEKEATPETLASDEQVSELKRLIDVLKLDGAVTDKWLEKAGAEEFSEMPAASVTKCIEWCQNQVTKGASK